MMQRTVKPKNQRSKRALQAREPKLVEDAKTCVFIRGSQTSARVRMALNELQLLKRPDAISFSKRNAVHPFDDQSPLLFWHTKTDASLFVHASHSKKRPDNLTFVRLFDGRVLDMLEVGVEGAKSIQDFAGSGKAAPGVVPLFHFVGQVWDQDERYKTFKSMILDMYRGEQMKAVDLVHGLQYVVSVSVGSVDDDTSKTSLLNSLDPLQSVAASTPSAPADPKPLSSVLIDSEPSTSKLDSLSSSALPLIHFRTYSITLLRSGHLHPRVALSPHGPFFDFRLRRHSPAAPDLLAQALKTSLPKTQKAQERKGKNKNIDVDEMGDKVGRVHVGKQDLGKLQSRKMRGLKRNLDDDADDSEDDEADGPSDLEMEKVQGEDDEQFGAVTELNGDEGSVKRRRT